MIKSKHIILKIKQNENGVLLPYMLFILIIISSFIVVTYDKVIFNLEQEEMIQEQKVIQNLIELSIYDFLNLKDELEISATRNHLTFTYIHGQTEVEYYLKESEQIQIIIRAITNHGVSHNFQTLLN